MAETNVETKSEKKIETNFCPREILRQKLRHKSPCGGGGVLAPPLSGGRGGEFGMISDPKIGPRDSPRMGFAPNVLLATI